jgi:hypothetical protein
VQGIALKKGRRAQGLPTYRPRTSLVPADTRKVSACLLLWGNRPCLIVELRFLIVNNGFDGLERS